MAKSLQQRAYAHIYKKLLNDEIPPGARLSNRALAKEIGVSVIPVREAINQLASKGLLDHQPGLGAFMPEPDAQEYIQLLEVREAMECHVAAKVAGHLSVTELAELEKHNTILTQIIEELTKSGQQARSPRQLERWHIADAAFHMVLLRAAGNPRILESVRDLRLMSRTLGRKLEPQGVERLARTRDDHSRIIEAVRAGSSEESRAMMAQHFANGRAIRLAALNQQNALTEGIRAGETNLVPDPVQNRLRELELDRKLQ